MQKIDSLVKWPIVYLRPIKTLPCQMEGMFIKTAPDMTMATMCAYPSSQHLLPRCKCVLCCCEQCPRIYFPDQELNQFHTTTFPKIRIYVYNVITNFTLNVG